MPFDMLGCHSKPTFFLTLERTNEIVGLHESLTYIRSTFVTKNKEGGFAPNYTPTATVDIDSGIVVHADVIFGHHEDRERLGAIDAVQQNLGLETLIPAVLADGLMSSGENIVVCKERGIDFISPIKLCKDVDNPAIREDLAQSVPAKDYDPLPTRKVDSDGK